MIDKYCKMDDITSGNQNRKELLKHMILQLHEGIAPDEVRGRLIALLKSIPYNEVVEVEQELINEGLPEEEVLKFCDIHTHVLEGHIDQSGAREIPEGHPVETFKKENRELHKLIQTMGRFYEKASVPDEIDPNTWLLQMKAFFNNLMDVVDATIVIPNERLFELEGADMSLKDAYKAADDVLLKAVRGISC